MVTKTGRHHYQYDIVVRSARSGEVSYSRYGKKVTVKHIDKHIHDLTDRIERGHTQTVTISNLVDLDASQEGYDVVRKTVEVWTPKLCKNCRFHNDFLNFCYMQQPEARVAETGHCYKFIKEVNV